LAFTFSTTPISSHYNAFSIIYSPLNFELKYREDVILNAPVAGQKSEVKFIYYDQISMDE